MNAQIDPIRDAVKSVDPLKQQTPENLAFSANLDFLSQDASAQRPEPERPESERLEPGRPEPATAERQDPEGPQDPDSVRPFPQRRRVWQAVGAIVAAAAIVAAIVIGMNLGNREPLPGESSSPPATTGGATQEPTDGTAQSTGTPGTETPGTANSSILKMTPTPSVTPAANAAECDLTGANLAPPNVDLNPGITELINSSPWLYTVVGCTPEYAIAVASNALIAALQADGGNAFYQMFQRVDGQWTQLDPARNILIYLEGQDGDFATVMDERFAQAGYPEGLRAELLPSDPLEGDAAFPEFTSEESTSLDGRFQGLIPSGWRYEQTPDASAENIVNAEGEFRAAVGDAIAPTPCDPADARPFTTVYAAPTWVGPNPIYGENNAQVVVWAYTEPPFYAGIGLVSLDTQVPNQGTACSIDMGMQLNGVSYFSGTSPFLPANGDLAGAPGRVLEFDSMDSIHEFINGDEFLSWLMAIRSQEPSGPAQ